MTPGAALDRVLGDALEAVRIVALLCSPAVPDTAQAVWGRIGLPGALTDQRLPEQLRLGRLPQDGFSRDRGRAAVSSPPGLTPMLFTADAWPGIHDGSSRHLPPLGTAPAKTGGRSGSGGC